MKVLIVTGGSGDERDISFISAGNVAIGLLRKDHTVEMFDFLHGYDKLEKKLMDIDVVFPVLHGPDGEGGDLQEFLEQNSVKYVGSDSKANRKGWWKINFKKYCDDDKIVTANWEVITDKTIDRFNKRRLPFVTKPENSGSSRAIYILKTEKDRKKVPIKNLIKQYKRLLVEDYIEGIEVTVGVLGEEILPVVEIRPSAGQWFDYENKYSGKTKEIALAPSLTEKQKKEVQEITRKIHFGVGCRHYSRSDFILGKDGKFYALEINTIPGLTQESLLPKAAKAVGISFRELCDRLVKMAL